VENDEVQMIFFPRLDWRLEFRDWSRSILLIGVHFVLRFLRYLCGLWWDVDLEVSK
jgi:hypothetical protein